MVRAPCCEKMGLKKGPWTPEEDQVLIAYIMRYGHGNWRALPKQSGLLRCGKSCRLRWTNYLRPDIKRGNFSREEEDTIIKLHELLGNRWSAIAARLPGRTDNEIKNVWHTHLKKRLKQNPAPQTQRKPIEIPECNADPESESIPKITDLEVSTTTHRIFENLSQVSVSPEHPCSDFSSSSSLTTDSSSILTSKNWNAFLANSAIEDEDSSASAGNLEENWPESFGNMDSFWSDALQEENTTSATTIEPPQFQLPPCSPSSDPWLYNPYNDENMDFWFNLLMGTGQLSVKPEF